MQQLLDHFHNTAASAVRDDNRSNGGSVDVQYSYDLTDGQLTLRSPRGVVVHSMLSSSGNSNDALDDTTASSFNAAVNVALKCATREASFEDVLSWLTQTEEGRFSSSMKIVDTPTPPQQSWESVPQKPGKRWEGPLCPASEWPGA
jgi:hypothetical protein